MGQENESDSDTAPLILPVENGPSQQVQQVQEWSLQQQGQQFQPPLPAYAVYPSGYPAPNFAFHNGQQFVYAAPPMMPYGSPVPPQIIYVQSPVSAVQSPPPTPAGPYHGEATAALVLYILSAMGIWLCALPSIILSWRLVSKGVIPLERRAAVVLCSIFEFLAWLFYPTLLSQGKTSCSNNHNGYYECDYFWYGWISIVVWWVVTIAFGIPRIIYTFNTRNNVPESSSK